MKKLGLIGEHLVHSKSPKIHQKLAEIFDKEIIYNLIETNEESLQDKLSFMKRGIYEGFNVTIPYKSTVIQYLDGLTEEASIIGAVNTIYLKHGKMIGDNTDYFGFKESFIRSIPKYHNKRIVLLGTGGAAKAVYKVLKDLNLNPFVISRSKREDSYFGLTLSYDELEKLDYDIIINTTPVGMFPDVLSSPLKEAFVKEKIVFDLIYNPSETQLMKYSKESYNGLDMLIIQAIKAFEKWFDISIKIDEPLLEKLRGVCHE